MRLKRRRMMGQAPAFHWPARPSKPCAQCGKLIAATNNSACLDCLLISSFEQTMISLRNAKTNSP
jgi:hypothetical protein